MANIQHNQAFTGFIRGGCTAALLASLAAFGMNGSQAMAESVAKPKAVVELFTSQGCSSCPPADALLQKLAKRSDVIALSFSVDYWDHIGWKDTLATRKNTQRQYHYASRKLGGDGRVYTPQAIVNGVVCAVGSNEARIEAAISSTGEKLAKSRVPIIAKIENSVLRIETGAAASENYIAGKVWVAAVTKSVDVAIQRGENEGRKITYVNAVRDIVPVGEWSGRAAMFETPLDKIRTDGVDFYVIALQADDNGAILGAVEVGRQ